MTTPRTPFQHTLAALAKVVFFVSLAVGALLAAVAVWGIVEARAQEAALGPDVPLVDLRGEVTMTEGWDRAVYVDGRSIETAHCEITAPDGTVQSIEGFDPVGERTRLGSHVLGHLHAETAGLYTVVCSDVEEAQLSDEYDPVRRGLLAIPGFAGLFLVSGVIPTAVISLVVWRLFRKR